MAHEEMRKIANGNKASNKVRKKPDDEEHRIQCECIRAFRYKYPNMNHNLFAVPNGGKRNKIIAGKMKAEGALAGVSDLIFLKSNRHYGALLIEVKTPKGRQQQNQKEWERKIIQDGYKYVVIHSAEEMLKEIEAYLIE